MSDSTYVSKPTIGWRLRALRAQQRKTATEMAALLSFTSETQYLDAESGSCVPLERYATLIGRLAVRYGVPVRTLLDDDAAPTSTTSSAGVGQSAHVEALSAFVQYMGVSTSFGAGGGGGAASTATSSSVGKRLQRLRLERELSIIDVCEAVNVDESFAHENRRLAAALHAVDGPVVVGEGPAPSRRSTTTTIMLNADTLSQQQQQQQQDEAATTTTTLTVESPGARRTSSTAAATAVDASKLTASAAGGGGATTRRRSSAAASQNRRRSSSSSNSATPRSTDPNKHEHSSSAKRSAAAAAGGGASTSDVGGAASHQVAPPPRRSTPPPALTSLSDLHSTAGAYLAATAATDEEPHDNDPLVGGLVTERDMERIEGGAHWLFERWMSVIRTFCTVCRVDPFFLLLGL